MDNFLDINRKIFEVVKKGDNSWLIQFIDWYKVWATNLPEQSKEDFKILYEKGSDIVKSQEKIYDHALRKTFEELKLPLGDEEWRVEYYIFGCSSVLLPGVRITSWFGRVPGKEGGILDGQAGLTLTQKDIELLYRIDDDEVNLEKNYFNSLPAVVTRVGRARSDGMICSCITLFIGEGEVYKRF